MMHCALIQWLVLPFPSPHFYHSDHRQVQPTKTQLFDTTKRTQDPPTPRLYTIYKEMTCLLT